jgi:hypothetical protein
MDDAEHISREELDQLRSLDNSNLKKLILHLCQHNWFKTAQLLKQMMEARRKRWPDIEL